MSTVVKVDLTQALMDGTLAQKLEALPIRMASWADEVLNQAADLMVGYAKVNVRVDTGALRNSIRKESAGRHRVRVRAGGYTVNVRTGRLVDYARIVEEKYPYMRPAAEMVKPEMRAMIEGGFLEMLRE